MISHNVSRLRSVHDRLRRQFGKVAERRRLRGVILQVLLRLKHEAVRRSILLVAALLTAAAGSPVHDVDLPMTNEEQPNRVTGFSRPSAASVDDTSVHNDASANTRTER